MIIPKYSSVLIWMNPASTESADVTNGASLLSRILVWIFSFLYWKYLICYVITFVMTTSYMKWASEKGFLVLKQCCSGTVFQSELGENTNQTLTGLKVGVIKEASVFPSSITGTESHSDLTQTQTISEEKKKSPN